MAMNMPDHVSYDLDIYMGKIDRESVYQKAADISEPVERDTNGEELQPSSRYWVVDGGDRQGDIYIYNSLIDIDNYLESFGDGGHDTYRSAVLSLYGYCPEAKMYRYLGGNRFEEEK
ncbi:hypothetical protein [Levilactobacillus lindianensis]|uniref:hypothetical protein n=1 Tax=Levilactobacillus lindianensis TaxID=2486018 RepID=UPI000F742541|nr:hypothetical protein [Levilactobacillus lindianensis]